MIFRGHYFGTWAHHSLVTIVSKPFQCTKIRDAVFFWKKNHEFILIFPIWIFLQFNGIYYIHRITAINFRTFSPLPQKPYTHYGHSPFLPNSPPSSPWQQLIYFLCLWICLFWTFYINGVIQYAVLCNWLLSLSIKFLSFIHVVACISTSFLFMAK